MGSGHGPVGRQRAGGRPPARSLPRAIPAAAVAVVAALLLGRQLPGSAQVAGLNLSNSPGPSIHPAVALAADGSALAVWEEGDAIWFSRRPVASRSTNAQKSSDVKCSCVSLASLCSPSPGTDRSCIRASGK